ncbi:MAG: cytochrome P460 family protein [Myxococcales bacterium]|nr:cytochrome P460 family protein [Myxococcales bacterium]
MAACGGGDGDDGLEAAFPADYASSYVEVRDCRPSGDHDLNHVVILADPAAAPAYQLRDRPFPIGAVVLKAEYDFGDDTCTGPVRYWTVMVQRRAGSSPATIDWQWQKVDNQRVVVTEDEPRCIGCHTTCGVAPDGYAGTCAIP